MATGTTNTYFTDRDLIVNYDKYKVVYFSTSLKYYKQTSLEQDQQRTSKAKRKMIKQTSCSVNLILEIYVG